MASSRDFPWRTQPPVGTGIDWSNPLVAGLGIAWYGGVHGKEAIRAYASPSGAVTDGVGFYGSGGFRSAEGDGTSAYLQIQSAAAQSNVAAGQDFTVAMLCLPGSQINVEPVSNRSSSTTSGFDWSVGNASVAGNVSFRICDGSNNFFNYEITGYDDGKWHLFFGWRSGSSIYVAGDGGAPASLSANSNALPASQALAINKRGTNYFAMPVGLYAVWFGRVLTQREQVVLSRNPWQLFRPARRRFYSAAASGPTITLSPTTLPGGTVGVAYGETISASGGTTPYTFAVSAGSLPPGLSLSSAGALTGTPTTAGTYSFTVTATDANSNMASQAYSAVTILSPSYGWEFGATTRALMWLAVPATPSHLNSISYMASTADALDVKIYSSATKPTSATVPAGATIIDELTASAGSGWESKTYGGLSVSGYLIGEFLSPGAAGFFMPEIVLPTPGEAASAYCQAGSYPLP